MLQPNFKELDSQIVFRYQKDLYETISLLNYKYVSEYLFDQYYNCKKAVEFIGPNVGLSLNAAWHWMRVWNFPTRSRSEAQQLRRQREKKK